MNINIIDLKERIRFDFDIDSDLILFKNYEKYQYFYIPNYRGYLHVFKYDVDSDYLKIEYLIEIPRNLEITFIEILSIDERRKDVYFSLYEKSEDFLVGLYKYSQIAETIDLLAKGEYSHIIYLNNNYSILKDEFDNNYLLEYRTEELYKFKVEEMKKISLEGFRIVHISDKEYLCLTNSFYDEYDIDEYFYKKEEKIELSGVYYIELDKFIDQVKTSGRIIHNVIKENTEYSYIFPVHINDKDDEKKYVNQYHFYEINFNERKLYLYELIESLEELKFNLIHIQDLSLLKDLYNLYVEAYPLEILKHDNCYLDKVVKILYPRKDEIHLSYRESYIKSIYDKNIFTFWNEPKDSKDYYTGTRIKDKEGNLYLEIRSEGMVLDNNKILVYESINLRQQSYFIEGNNRYYTDMQDVFNSIKNKHLNYNWLITNIEISSENDMLINKLDSEYLYYTGEELDDLIKNNDIQWINARFIGFEKNRSKAEILEYIDDIIYEDNLDKYFEEIVELQHPLSIIEIIAFDSTMCMLISEEDDIINDFKSYYEDAKKLQLSNKLIRMQKKEIEDILKEMEIGVSIDYKDIVSSIWFYMFKEIYLDPYIEIEKQQIIKYLYERGIKYNE